MNLIVYHIFCVSDYLDVVKKQVDRLVSSGLYEWADSIEVSCVDKENVFVGIDEIFLNYPKFNVLKTDRNHYEWWGMSKMWDIAQENTGKVLYLHTKGVSNKYLIHGGDEISELKVNGVKWWKEMLEHFCIDNWKDCVDALDEVDNCGATCNTGWWWGNFWWSNLSWIKDCEKPVQGDRWYFEAWLNHRRVPKIKEFYHFIFNPYFSILTDELYKNKNYFKDKEIVINFAEYGVLGIQQDEGQLFTGKTTLDVTEIVKQNLTDNDYKFIDIRVDNTYLGGDPIWGFRKFLIVNCSVGDEVLQFCFNEGSNAKLDFFNNQ